MTDIVTIKRNGNEAEQERQSREFKMNDFIFSPTGMTAESQTFDSFDKWSRTGEFIRLTNQASQFWWGDWLNIGEDLFGSKASQALEETRWDEETLSVYAWVCKNVPPVNRLIGVPFSHYLQLAKLPHDQQRQWAEQVRDKQWSKRQLKMALNGQDASAEKQCCVLIRCADEKEAESVEEWAADCQYAFERLSRLKRP